MLDNIDLSTLGAGLATVGLATLVFLFLRVAPPPLPTRGPRGAARRRSRERGGALRWLELPVRSIAGHIASLPLAARRMRLEADLISGGDYLGYTPDEFIALEVVAAIIGLGSGLGLARLMHLGPGSVILITGLGALLPALQLRGAKALRQKLVDRGLPAAIDLCSMCMGAGLDFPGSIRQVVDNMVNTSPVREELSRLLDELDLGRTRKQALLALSERVPTAAVRELACAVIQAEERGNPLAEVLGIQAGLLRQRRSVAAEESAARAGVMMMLPMMMLFASVFLILMGPFVVRIASGGE